MGNINADVIRVELATESLAATTLKPKMRAHAKDTRRIVWMEGDNTLRYAWDSTRLADQSGVYGVAVIGSPAIAGITPAGGSPGASANLASMLGGIALSTVLKSPYNSTINTIQPTAANFIPLTLKGFVSQSVDMLQLQTSAGTSIARFDSQGNLALSRAQVGGNVGVTVQNTDNTSGSGANILIGVGGSSAADPWIRFNTNGSQDWSVGSDTSAGRNFIIAASSALGAGSDWLIITPAGAFTLNGATSIANNLSVTGNATIGSGSGAPVLNINGAAGNRRIAAWQTAGVNRWTLRASNGTESGSDVGSDLELTAFTDAGAGIDNPITITRQTGGAITMARQVSLQSSLAFTVAASGGTGRIWMSSGAGLAMRGVTGTTYDFDLISAGGSDLIRNPTGTNNLEFPNGATSFVGNMTLSRASAGGTVLATISNTDNTNGASNASAQWSVGGASAGDPYIRFTVSGATDWSVGADNSDSDKWKVSLGTSLGSSDALTIDSSLNVLVPGGDFFVSRTASGYVTAKIAQASTLVTQADARLYLESGAGSNTSGDPFIYFSILSGADWSIGPDNSDSDKFKISNSTGLGTNDRFTITTAGAVSIPSGDLTVSRANAASNVIATVQNTDNTSVSSSARLDLLVGGASAGDPFIRLGISGGTSWALGTDNSDSQSFKISRNPTLGSSDALVISPALLATFYGSVSLDGTPNTTFRFPRVTAAISSPLEGMSYWDPAGKHLMIYSGTAWITVV